MDFDDDIQLADIVKELSAVDDVSWGLYAFSRDRYREKVSEEDKLSLIKEAIAIGQEEAGRISAEFGSSDPSEIARALKLRIDSSAIQQQKGRIVFATFSYPDLITLMSEPISRALSSDEVRELISEEEIRNLMIGHEIYHVLEERRPALHTSDRKVVLWKFLGKEHTGTLGAPSEIAASSFTKTLNSSSFSPLILDIMLYWGYNREDSYNLYKEVIKFYKNGNCEKR